MCNPYINFFSIILIIKTKKLRPKVTRLANGRAASSVPEAPNT